MAPSRPLVVRNLDRDALLGDRVRPADTWWRRAMGLLGRQLGEREGLLLLPCRAVHMFGMRQPLDVAFVDAGHRVVAAYPDLQPRRMTRYHREAVAALELPAGTLARTATRVGDRLTVVALDSEASTP